MTKKINRAQIDTINQLYEETFGTLPSNYEMAVEKHCINTLDKRDLEDLNRQTTRYNAECGECIVRKATEAELNRARR